MENVNDLLEKIREKYRNHASILAILQKQFEKSYPIQIISKEETEKETLSLNDTKAAQQPNILTKIIKMNVDIFCKILHLDKT